jgi:hypothetical protein
MSLMRRQQHVIVHVIVQTNAVVGDVALLFVAEVVVEVVVEDHLAPLLSAAPH